MRRRLVRECVGLHRLALARLATGPALDEIGVHISPGKNPFGMTPLADALHRALDATRVEMTPAGFDVRHLVMVAQPRHPAAPAYGNSAVAFPMAEPVLHAELLRGAADVFEPQAARIHYEQGEGSGV